MKITRIIAFLTAGLVTLALASCKDKDEPDDKADDLSNVTFTVGTSDIDYDNINIIVRHDGPKDITWYGFVSEGNSTDIEALISSRLGEVSEAGLHIGDNQTVHLEGLKDNSVYQYVAFGVNPDKTRFGVPGSCSFTTDMDKNKVTFDLKISNVSYTSAEAEVSLKEGRDDYTWYGVVTTDVEAEDAEIISKAIKNLKPSDLYSGTQATVKLDGLAFGTDYKYVVFGITPELVQYGTPSSATFKTESIEFAPKSEWTVTYDGIDSEDKNAPYIVSVTSTEETTAYSVVVLDASAFDENTDPSVIAQNAAGQAYSEVSKAVAAGKSLSDVLKRGTSSTNFKLELGTYVAVAVGFDAEGMVNGDYAMSEAFSFADNRTPYEKWLGTWSYSAVGSDFEITVTQKTVNSTYTITGFTGEYPIEAGFDPETGGLFINGGQVLADGYEIQTDSGTAVTTLYLYGLDSDDYVEHGNPDKNLRLVLGTLDKDANTAKFEGDVYDAVYSGNTWHEVIVSFGIFAVTAENKYYSLRDYPHTNLPGTLTRTGDGDNPGKVSYESWLGNWTYSSAESNRSITISQKKANSSYTITGFTGEYPIEATYEASTGGINIASMQKLDSGVQLSEDLTVDMYLFGVDSNNSLVVGNPNKGYRVVLGKLGVDGKTASFEGDEYDDEYEGEVTHEEIVLFGLFAVTPDFSDLYTLNDSPLVDLPGSLSKASSGVSRKVGSGVYTKNPSKVHAASVRGYEKPFSFSGKYAVGTQYYRRAK